MKKVIKAKTLILILEARTCKSVLRGTYSVLKDAIKIIFRRTGILKLKQIYKNLNLKIIDVLKVATPAEVYSEHAVKLGNDPKKQSGTVHGHYVVNL